MQSKIVECTYKDIECTDMVLNYALKNQHHGKHNAFFTTLIFGVITKHFVADKKAKIDDPAFDIFADKMPVLFFTTQASLGQKAVYFLQREDAKSSYLEVIRPVLCRELGIDSADISHHIYEIETAVMTSITFDKKYSFSIMITNLVADTPRNIVGSLIPVHA